jgi:hypothetical protein
MMPNRPLRLLLLSLVVLSIYSTQILAIGRPTPRSPVRDAKTVPECLIVTSELPSRPSGSVIVINDCDVEITLTGVKTSPSVETPQASVLPVSGDLWDEKIPDTQYQRHFYFFLTTKETSSTALRSDHILRPDCPFTPLPKVNKRHLCRSIHLPPGYAVSFGMKTASYFTISGTNNTVIEGYLAKNEEYEFRARTLREYHLSQPKQ